MSNAAGHSAKSFRHPVHFVCPMERLWPELRDDPQRELDEDTIARRCINCTDTWVVRTYCVMRRAGYDVTLSDKLEPNRINISSIQVVGRRNRGFSDFVVLARCDHHESKLANVVIRHNTLREPGALSLYLPTWLQPGIIPRDPARGDAIKVLGYKGLLVNLDPDFRSDAFREELARRGMTLEASEASPAGGGEEDWADYSGCDITLAVRNMRRNFALAKPGSKLVNAWWADTPALLGPEPAFQEMRESELDYMEVRTPQDALDALDKLQADPALYRAMVDNGRRRREAFSEPAMLAQWAALIDGPIREAYEAWQRKPKPLRALEIAVGMARESGEKRRFEAFVKSGPKLIE